MYRSFYKVEALPEAGSLIEEQSVKHRWFAASQIKTQRRAFIRSSAAEQTRRSSIRIAIPKVLNIWATAPMWRTYFECLGITSQNLIFSDESSQEMWKAGGKYGSIDPCYPL